jgi:receptor expression-enhancing protein 5/6
MNNSSINLKSKEEIKKNFDNSKKLRVSQPEMKKKKEFTNKYMKADTLVQKINKYLADYRIVNKICDKLKIDPIYILIVCLIPVVILLFKYFTITTTMIALIYPLYKSFKTLQKKSFNQEKEDAETTRWLSYWLIYAFINNSECIFWKFFEKIKIYNLIKFIFLILCFIPKIKLSLLIYNFFTSKIYDKYGEKFEKNTVEFFRKIFGGRKSESNFETKDNNSEELIEEVFSSKKITE